MKQLAINVQKNVTIIDLVCTPNVILLAKQSTTTNTKTGEVSTSVRFIEVCKVEKTDALTIVQSLLKYCITEYFVCSDIDKDFADTNIKQRKIFNQFLSGNTIYRTNSEGKIANALESEVPFTQTALKVKDYHTITTCKKENLKAAIFQHSKAILSLCKYLRLIIDKAETLETETAQSETTTKRKATAPAIDGTQPIAQAS
ncbi:hypothetical protein BN938_1796 [Mucinivorans hirudinis]|uniref:Uncharacterized protein n=1 Tax=Mucinivorans hirudinis TaxID=1433126 RepID=A0A060R8L8_9BACT|nr:hypothetical protein BN938_1796 [Mucinivorans hirudinis]